MECLDQWQWTNMYWMYGVNSFLESCGIHLLGTVAKSTTAGYLCLLDNSRLKTQQLTALDLKREVSSDVQAIQWQFR